MLYSMQLFILHIYYNNSITSITLISHKGLHMFGVQEDLADAKNEALKALQERGEKPKIFTWKNITAYFQSYPTTIKLIREEPEILLFLAIEWVTIILAYLLWIQFYGWIPPDVWETIKHASKDEREYYNVALGLAGLGWSCLVLIIASYPIAICNAAIITSHNLRANGQNSTIFKCLALAYRNLGRLWAFTFVDAYITVDAIIDRLPSKNNRDRRTALDELLYYAWKVGTIGVVPALVNGRGLFQGGKDSITLLKANPAKAIGLRMGYSAVCWIVGIIAYPTCAIATVWILGKEVDATAVYTILLALTIPLVIVIGIVTVILRPPFLLGIAKFYSDTITLEDKKSLEVNESPLEILLTVKNIAFISLLAIGLTAALFSEQLGIQQWVQKVAREEGEVVERNTVSTQTGSPQQLQDTIEQAPAEIMPQQPVIQPSQNSVSSEPSMQGTNSTTSPI